MDDSSCTEIAIECELATVAYNLRLPGQVFDGQAGLHQNSRRDYDPAVGRYFESDPLGVFDSPGTYTYTKDYPIGLTDRFGLMTDGDCCLRSQALGQNDGDQGWVICCEGRKVPCAFSPKVPSRAADIRRKCTLAHENTHLPEIQCKSCTPDPTRPNRSGPGALPHDASECRGARAGVSCLRRSISDYGLDEECRKSIQSSINNDAWHNRYCNPAP
jgi:RHS repeat-associated protein